MAIPSSSVLNDLVHMTLKVSMQWQNVRGKASAGDLVDNLEEMVGEQGSLKVEADDGGDEYKDLTVGTGEGENLEEV